MTRQNILWGIGGGVIGAIAFGGLAIYIVVISLPWDAICATVGPLEAVATLGASLAAELRAWLDAAATALSSRPEAPESASAGLGGLLERAQEIGADVSTSALDVITAPLQSLIALASETLGAVERVLAATADALSAIDRSRCS